MRAVAHGIVIGTILGGWCVLEAQAPRPPDASPRPGEVTTAGGRSAPPRDARSPRTGIGRIRGLVVSADGGLPLRRVVVRLTGGDVREGRATVTDADGRYELRDLPAGRYRLIASKGGYIELMYGQRRPFEEGRPIELRDTERLDGIDFSLPRAGVITGRIVDEFGDPVAEVMVQALRPQYVRGRRRLIPAGRFTQSNDIGVYRVYGLPPGDYFVSATVHGGGHFLQRTDEVPGYAPTYYPGTPNLAEAQRIPVAIGQEAAADLQLLPARLSRISGLVTDSTGRPLARGMAVLIQRTEGEVLATVGFGRNATSIDADGSFTLAGVAPGAYALNVSAPGRMRRGRPPEEGAEFASMPVTVTGADIEGLVIQTSRGGTIRGRVVIEGGPAPFAPSDLNLFLEPRDGEGLRFMAGRPLMGDDWTFELQNVAGPVLLSVRGLPPGWQLGSVLAGTDDVTDLGLDLKPGQPLTGLRVTITNQITELTGAVGDDRGRWLKDYVVVVFADDPAKWELPSGRYVRSARPDQEGLYRIEGLPPGRYLAVAVDAIERGSESDPAVLEVLRTGAVEVVLGAAEKKALNLTLQGAL